MFARPRAALAALAFLLPAGTALRAQAPPRSSYPVAPAALPDSEEIALAMSAAPAEISARATVYAVRGGRVVRLREGTNGCACTVSRDAHDGSLYPICYDVEGTRTLLWKELLEVRLRTEGRSEEAIVQAVAAAYADGSLQRPNAMTVAYMMPRGRCSSPRRAPRGGASAPGGRTS